MRRNTLQSVISLILALAMLFEMVPTSLLTAYAVDDTCTHHTHSGESCSYREEVVCTHIHDTKCYVNCTHTCDDGCGYREEIPGVNCNCGAEEGAAHTEECTFREAVPGAICQHICSEESGCVTEASVCGHTEDGVCCYIAPQECDFICQECLAAQVPENTESSAQETVPVEPTEEEETAPVCNCGEGEKCASDLVKEDCQVCAADMTLCQGTEAAPAPVCNCGEGEKCATDLVKEGCQVCAADVTLCQGTEAAPAPVCNCGEGEKCAPDRVKEGCQVCAADVTLCQGTEAAPAPVCNCGEGEKCAPDRVKEDCRVCVENTENCEGKETAPAQCVCEYRCLSAEDGRTCPVCGAEEGWTKCEKEPRVQAEPAEGTFGVAWSNRSHGGAVPDLSGDIRVLDAAGSAVEAAISKNETGYSVSGLLSGSTYTLELVPGADAVYSVSGSRTMELRYNSETGCYVGGDFDVRLNTYTLLYNIVWPEGMTAPEGFAPVITLGDAAVSVPQSRTEEGILVSDLYQVDGDYILQLPQIEGMITKRYTVPFNSKTEQPMEIRYTVEELFAEFVIYWNDLENVTGRRTLEELAGMVTFKTEDGRELTGLTVEGKKQERSEIAGYEKYIYTVDGITGYTGTTLKLEWEEDALLGYDALYTAENIKLAQGFEPVFLRRNGKEALFASDLAYAFVLPRYSVKLNVRGLNDNAEECLQTLLDSIAVTRMDLMTGEETPFTGYTVSREGDTLYFHGLFANTLENIEGVYEVLPAYYTLTWPDKIGKFDLSQDSDRSLTVFRQMGLYALRGSADFTANLSIGAPSYTAQVDPGAYSETSVVWYDTTNQYPHSDALELETTLTINGVTVTLSTGNYVDKLKLTKSADSTSNSSGYKDVYTYSFGDNWTVEAFCEKFGITLEDSNTENHPTAQEVQNWIDHLVVTVTNNGDNYLNRTVTAEAPGALRIDREQFTIHEPEYIKYDVSVGEVQVTKVDASTDTVQKYVIGSLEKDGETYTVLYPIVEIHFTVQLHSGYDDPRGPEWNNGGSSATKNDFTNLIKELRIHYKKDGVVVHQILQPEGTGLPSKLEELLELPAGALGPTGGFYKDGLLDPSTGIGVYTFLLPLYDAEKEDIEYCMSMQVAGDDVNKNVVKLDGRDYYFRVEYDNTAVSGHGTDIDQAYQEGKVIMIRTGETNFRFYKYWEDGYDTASDAEKAEILAARPTATYEVWRYSNKLGGNSPVEEEQPAVTAESVAGSYKTSARVPTPENITLEIPTTASAQGAGTLITVPAGFRLDKYDNEGYEYVYFIREHMNAGSGYTTVVGRRQADGTFSDALPEGYIDENKDGMRDPGDNSIYYDGALTNVKTDKVAATVTKTWVGAYYQDQLKDVNVNLTLYRKTEQDTEAEQVMTRTMSDFDAYNLTQSITVDDLALYDAAGNRYSYWWEETSVTQDNAQYPAEEPAGLSGISKGSNINAAAPVFNDAQASSAAQSDGEGGETQNSIRYYLPMNAATVKKDSYSPTSKEYFEVTSWVDDDGVTHFTNTLEGTTEYWVRKTWDPSLTPGRVEFPLLQINAAGEYTEWSKTTADDPAGNPEAGETHPVFALEQEQFTLVTAADGKEGYYDSGWHKGYVNLPKYDEDGNLYTYIAREGDVQNAEPISAYGKDVDEGGNVGMDSEIETQSLHVHNAKVGRDIIHLRKIWLDDSAFTDRTNVQFEVVAYVSVDGQEETERVVLYGKNQDQTDGLYGTYVTLAQATDWLQTKDVTLYRDAQGGYHTHQAGEENPVMPAVEEGQEQQPEQYTRIAQNKVTYAVTEHSLGSVTAGDLAYVQLGEEYRTQAGYSTVQYGNTKYAVIYNDGNLNRINAQQTTAADDKGYYTVTNLRIGTEKLGVSKIWQDDGTVPRINYNARVELKCATPGMLITVTPPAEGENPAGESLSYVAVHPAVYPNGRMPVMGGTSETEKKHVSLVQKVPTAGVYDPETQAWSIPTVYYYELPLYDASGKILEYNVQEFSDQIGETFYEIESSPVEYQSSTATQYVGVKTLKNTYKDTTSVRFNLLWLDDYRDKIDQRPDMYLNLYYAKYEYVKDENGKVVLGSDGLAQVVTENGKPKYTLERYDYQEYSWNESKHQTEDFWYYVFEGLPNYDEYGRKISYYATVNSLTEMANFDYLVPQYAIGEVNTNALFQSEGKNQSKVNDDGTVDYITDYFYASAGNNPLPEDYPIRKEGEHPVVLQSDNTFVLQLSSKAYVQGHKVWENVPVGFEESELPLLNFMLKRELTEEEKKEGSLSPFHATVDRDGVSRINLAAILNYRSPSQDYTFDMHYMGLLTRNANGKYSVIQPHSGENATTVTYNNGTTTVTGTPLEVWMHITGIRDAKIAAELYGKPLPKYDSYGTLYKYQVIDTYVQTDNEGFKNNGVIIELKPTINEYKIVNSFKSVTGAVNVSKNWYRFDSSHPFQDTANAVYPDMEFRLYRFVQMDRENYRESTTNPGSAEEKLLQPAYTEPELVKTVAVSGSEVKAKIAAGQPYVTFDVEIYAPNGNPFIYVVAEKKIPGFNTAAGDPAVLINNALDITLETDVTNHPDFDALLNSEGDGYWRSGYFRLMPVTNTGNGTQPAETEMLSGEAATAVFGNVYTAMEQTKIDFEKEWDDGGNKFNSRPDSLSVVLKRSLNDGSKEEQIGIFTISNVEATRGQVTVTWSAGFAPENPLESDPDKAEDATVYRNLTSTEDASRIRVKDSKASIPATSAADGNFWKMTVENLDKHGPDGKPYRYYWREHTVPAGYTSTVTEKGLKNTLSTNLNVFKRWDNSINQDLAKPTVTVRLMVTTSLEEPVVWQDAKTFANAKLAELMKTTVDGQSVPYEFDRELDAPYWYAHYANLPTGYNQQPLYYTVKEIAIDDQPLSDKNAGWTVTVTDSADQRVPSKDVTNTPTTTQLTVTKVWDDENNVYDTRYLNGDGNWEVSYHIYRKTATGNPEILKNTFAGNRPETLEDYVLTVRAGDRDGVENKTKNDSTSNSAYKTVTGLPTHNAAGERYTYYAVELNPDRNKGTSAGTEITNDRYDNAYGVSVSHPESTGFHDQITNSLTTTNLEVTKVWVDDQNFPDVRPEDPDATDIDWGTLKITLTQYGGEYGEEGRDITAQYEKTANDDPNVFKWTVAEDAQNQWKIVFTGLPKTSYNGEAYTYKVKEAQVPGYQPAEYENGTPAAGGNQSYQINNTITKFRIEKWLRDNADDTSADVSHNITLVFTGSENATNSYQLVWWREGTANSYTESYAVTKNGEDWSSGQGEENQPVDIYGLPEGEYALTDESNIPAGYYAPALGQSFTLKTDSGKQTLTVTGQKALAAENSAEALPTLKVDNYKTTLLINKLGKVIDSNGNTVETQPNDLSANSEWVFSIEGVFADKPGATEARAYSTNNRAETKQMLGQLIVGNQYTMTETATPDGYTKSDRSVTFTVTKSNKVDILKVNGVDVITDNGIRYIGDKLLDTVATDGDALTFKNEPFRVTVEKFAMVHTKGENTESYSVGDALENAQYQLYALSENGGYQLIWLGDKDTLTTDSNGKILIPSNQTEPKLKADGTTQYLIMETKAPAGYILEDVAGPTGYENAFTHPWVLFKFTTGGELTAVTSSGMPQVSHAYIERSGNNVKFTDDPIELYLMKHDNGDALEAGPIDLGGITFQLKNSDGTEVLGSVTTDADGCIDFSDLKNGQNTVLLVGGTNYVLSEVACGGYYRVGDIKFTLHTNGSVTVTDSGRQNVGDQEKANDFAATTQPADRANTTFLVGNDRIPGTVILTKESPHGNLSDVSFKLYWEKPQTTFAGWLIGLLTGRKYELVWSSTGEGNNKQVVVTAGGGSENTAGELKITNLPWGNYKLVEEAPKDGFLLPDNNEISFTIGKTSTNVYVTRKESELTNNTFQVQITKKNASVGTNGGIVMGSNGLNGAAFQLLEQRNGQWVDTGKTYTSRTVDGKDGIVVVKSTETVGENTYEVVLKSSTSDAPQWYRLKETGAPTGYKFFNDPEDAPYVDFWVSQTGRVKFRSEHTYVSINNGATVGNLPIKLTLHKYDGGDEYRVGESVYSKDVVFSIKEQGETGNGTSLKMTNGSLTIGIEQGNYTLERGKSYTVTETRVQGYKDLGSFNFNVSAEGEITVTSNTTGVTNVENDPDDVKIVNIREKGKVTLTKKDSGGKWTLNGAEFQLRRKNAPQNWLESLTYFVTGNTYSLEWSNEEGNTVLAVGRPVETLDGKLVISGLPWGEYVLEEIKAPVGYKLPAKQVDRIHEFVINDEKVEEQIPVDFVNVTNAPAQYTFHKRCSKTNSTLLPGAVFQLKKDGEDREIATYTADSNGEFTVSSVGADGSVIIELSVGSNRNMYTLSETTAPHGYERSNTFAKFYVDELGNFHIEEAGNMNEAKDSFLNTPIELKLVKLDGGDRIDTQQKPLANVRFQILDQNGEAIEDISGSDILTTDNDGKATLPVLKMNGGDSTTTSIVFPVAGRTYRLREIKESCPGFEELSDIIFTVDADGTVKDVGFVSEAGKTAKGSVTASDDTITVTNQRVLGKVKLVKKDDNLEVNLSNAVFELRRDTTPENLLQWLEKLLHTGQSYTVAWTNNTLSMEEDTQNKAASGELIISDLPWGEYTLVEIQPPAGYKLATGDSQIRTFTIDKNNAEEEISLDYVDNDSFSFRFFKHALISKDNWDPNKPLSGAVFKLTDAAGNELKTYISGEDGSITVKSAEKVNGQHKTYMEVTTDSKNPTRYRITEHTAPKGYELPGNRPEDRPYVEFWVDKNGAFQLSGTSSNGVAALNGNYYFTDKPIELTVNKYEIDAAMAASERYTATDVTFRIKEKGAEGTGTEIIMQGGVLQLGVNSPNPSVILVGGKTYQLTEDKVPGYDTLKTVEFTVNYNGDVSDVKFVDTETEGVTYGGSVEQAGADSICITNRRVPGEVLLTKIGDSAGVKLDGAVFDLYKDGGSEPWITGFETGYDYTVTVDASGRVSASGTYATKGELHIANLPWGQYSLVEVKAPKGYKLAQTGSAANPRAHDFVINAEAEGVVQLIENVQNSSFTAEFFKHVSVNGTTADSEKLADAHFTLVRKSDNVQINTYISDEEGRIVLDSIGQTDPDKYLQVTEKKNESTPILYILTETQAPKGYELPDEAPFVEFWFDETGTPHYETASHAVDNKFLDKPIRIRLNKRDFGDAFAPEDKLAGITFQILDEAGNTFAGIADGADTVITGEEGTVMLPVIESTVGEGNEAVSAVVFPVGGTTYRLRETTPNGYHAVKEIIFTVEDNGNLADVRFDGTVEKGTVTGTTVQVDGETGVEEIRVSNYRRLGSVTLTKKTDYLGENFNLNDARFTLSREDDAQGLLAKLKEFFTGKIYTLVWTNTETEDGRAYSVETNCEETGNGQLIIHDLPWGTYVLTETQAPNGFVMDAAHTFEFTIGPDNQEEDITIDWEGDISNNWFQFTFSKHATVDGKQVGEALTGAKYKLEVSTDGGATWSPVETDQSLDSGENTSITLRSVEEIEIPATEENGESTYKLRPVLIASTGEMTYTYRITEIQAPKGYELPDEAPFVEFRFDTSGVLHIDEMRHAVKQSDSEAAFTFLDKPIELALVKYDGGDRGTEVRYTFDYPDSFREFDKLGRVDGITFTLTDEEGKTQTATTDNGILTFGLAEEDHFRVVGGQTYVLAEKNAADLSYTGIAPVTFTVAENGTVLLKEGTAGAVTVAQSGTVLRVVNDRTLGTVTLEKRSQTGEKLDNVVFHLYREDVSAGLPGKPMAFVTGKTYTLEKTFRWGKEATKQITEENGTQVGVLTIRNLDWGRYKLVETYSDGFVLEEDVESRTYTFEIGPDNAKTGAALAVEINAVNTPNSLLVQKVGEGDTKLLTGAQYELYFVGQDGKTTQITNATDRRQPMWAWNSKTGTGEATRLKSGTYRLVETKSPYGYVIAQPMEFSVDQQGNVTLIKGNGRVETKSAGDSPVLVAEDYKTLFRFTKAELYNEYCSKQAWDTRLLPGATFTAYEDAAMTKVIGTAVSDAKGIVTFYGLPLKDYKGAGTSTPVYIRETATVTGHVLDQNVYKVYLESGLDEKGQVVSRSSLVLGGKVVTDNTVVNDVFRADFSFTKVSERNNLYAIPGAEYGLYKTVRMSAGPIVADLEILVAKAKSDSTGVVVFPGLLMDTVYTVKELSVPSGCYVSENSISFMYTWNNGAQLTVLDDGEGTVTAGDDGLLWQEPQVVVSILKVNSGKKPLAGATLQIRDKHGNVIPVLDENGKLVYSWVSTTEALVISGVLEAGETYYLYELKAPSGFVKARRQRFTIPNEAMEPGENHVVKVTMVNYRSTEIPQTGDDIMVAASAMGVSAAALMILLLLKKKKK